METFKTMLFFSDFEEGTPRFYPTIWYENAWWIVGTWLESLDKKAAMPEILVRLTGLPHQEVNLLDCRFVLTNSIPKSVLCGKAQDGYTIAYHPAAIAHTQGPRSIH